MAIALNDIVTVNNELGAILKEPLMVQLETSQYLPEENKNPISGPSLEPGNFRIRIRSPVNSQSSMFI
jgi:hypothetical protein